MRIGPALGAQHAASRTVQAPPLLYFAPPLSGVATPSYQPMRPRFAGRARAEPEKPEKPPSPSPTISTIVNLVGAPGEDASSSDAKSKNVADTTASVTLSWMDLPNMGRPLRKTASNVTQGLLDDDRGFPFLLDRSTARTGRLTKVGEPVDLPLSEPTLSYVIIGLVVGVYAIGISKTFIDGADVANDFLLGLAKDNKEVLRGELWRMLTSGFVHAGLLHLGFNTLALWQLAPEVEAVMGPWVFVAIYTLSQLSGATAAFLLTDTVTLGASGAVFGMLGALAGYFFRNPMLENRNPQLTLIVMVVVASLSVGLVPSLQVDNTGHFGGLIAGLFLGFAMGPRFVVIREPSISDGAMDLYNLAEDDERQVVVDQNTAASKALGAGAFTLSLLATFIVGFVVRSEGL